MATQDIPIIRVLMALHPGMDTLDFAGPLEILSHAQHNISDASKLFHYYQLLPICSFPPNPSLSYSRVQMRGLWGKQR